MGWGGRQEGGSGRGTHVNPWLIHVNVWQKPLQYYNIVISLQLIKINGKKNLKKEKSRDRKGVQQAHGAGCGCRVTEEAAREAHRQGPGSVLRAVETLWS